MEADLHFPRFSIAGLMAVVLLVALDCMCIKLFMDRPYPGTIDEHLLFGALPMANVLAIGLGSLWNKRRSSTPWSSFLRGFEVCGAVALFCYVWWAVLWPMTLNAFLNFVLGPLPFGPLRIIVGVPLILITQIAAGVLGGLIVRANRVRLRISLSFNRRPTVSVPSMAVPTPSPS